MKTKRSSLRNSVVENNNEKTAVYSQNGSITDIMATDDGKFQYSKDGGQSFEEVSTQVDNTLSTTSENPVQNKVITKKFNDIYNANTHTLTVENAQIDGNITDGTNTVTVANIATKVKFITLTSTTNTQLTDEQKGILLEDENNYIVAGGRVFRYSNNLSTADNVKFYTFVGNGATTEDKIIQTCSFFSGNTPALLSFNSEVNINNLATKNDIPTNNNQLENGAGYITSPEFIATSYDLINPVSSKIVDNSVSSGPKNKWIFNKMFYEGSMSDVQSSIRTIYNFLNSLNLETDKVYNCLVGNDVGILLKSKLPGNSKYSYLITAFGERNCYFYVADTAATTRFVLRCFFSTDVYNTLFLNGIWK